ncbi:ESX secretion-associated protein EspG [Mycobacterium simiae]|uniref:ESX secretion-associated protein EspG n=1 Tax=Mycobacterium simiae TaxID=1784 RepID=A0A5B1B5Q4_MYCSI|nr:ESX secretion-associated protein EspG [Mycobacterium simiae]KAA1242960.1 ESX secretion-associated protein EspG [Mycobacterium simiae]
MTAGAEHTAAGTDITVNLDGLWLLQALLGITRLAPELRGRPYGQPRSPQWATRHPGLKVLVDQGICDHTGAVRADVADRLTVLGAPDVEVILLIGGGPLTWSAPMLADQPATWRAIPEQQLRVVLARRGGRWASAVRAGGAITLDDCAPADPQTLARLAGDALDSLHPVPPGRFPALTVPLEDMCAAVAAHARAGSAAAKQAALQTAGLRGTALSELGAALDEPRAEAVLYARAHVDAGTAVSESVLNLRDSASGRVALYRLCPPRGSRQDWMTLAPATPAQLCHGVTTVLGSVAVASWDTHERMA